MEEHTLWDMLHDATARSHWSEIWDELEHSSVALTRVDELLWHSTADLPAPDKPLLYSSAECFLGYSSGEYPRVCALHSMWRARLMAAQELYDQQSMRSGGVAPSLFFDPHLEVVGCFASSFAFQSMDLCFEAVKASSDGPLADALCGYGVTPDGVRFSLSQVDARWLADNRIMTCDEEQEMWLSVRLCIDTRLQPYSASVDSILCALGTTPDALAWSGKPESEDYAWLYQFTPHRVMARGQDGEAVEVGRFDSRSAATIACKNVACPEDERLYWVEPIQSAQ